MSGSPVEDVPELVEIKFPSVNISQLFSQSIITDKSPLIQSVGDVSLQ